MTNGDRAGADAVAPAALSDESLWPVLGAIGLGVAVCTMIVDDAGTAVDYRFDEVNEHFAEMTGLADPVGRTALELVPGLEQVWVDTYARVGLGGETLQFEQESAVMRRWFEVSATPLPRPGRLMIVFTDQTERRRAQEAVRRQDDVLRQIADDLPVMLWATNINGQFAFVNQTFRDYFGVPRSQGGLTHWRLPTHPDDGDRHLGEFSAAVDARRDYFACVRVRRSDGEWRSVESWGRPRFDDVGDYVGHLGGAIDVTERIDAEQQRELLLERERQGRARAEILERYAVAARDLLDER